MDLSIFLTAEAWISLVTLVFLEIVLGVDNIVFISITSDRLPPEKQHIGRKLGLFGAMLMRIAFLSVASFFVHMVTPLFTLDFGFWSHGFSVRDIILLAGGAYLIYKGISELHSTVELDDLKEEATSGKPGGKRIGLPQAIATIMVMDIVFSIDSVITAVGLADHLIIMILAVMTAVFIMMLFIDPISNFINRNAEMKILALTFIAMIGVLLVLDSLGINSGIEVLDMHMEKLMVYFAMLFGVIMELIQIRYKTNLKRWDERTEDED
ncbi:MAG: TerC family protein [Eggerthellaceae bacterium]|nr:TerC family protein [Eggerthellaceae bacterium]